MGSLIKFVTLVIYKESGVIVIVMSTTLKQIREGFAEPKVSQEELAHKSKVTLQTYRNAEAGRNCSYTTATSILRAVNDELQERGQNTLNLEQLNLKIV